MVIYFLLCYQTDGSVPNTLVIANCEVVKPRVAAAEHISQVMLWLSFSFSFLSMYFSALFCAYANCFVVQFNEEARSPFVKKYKTIIHPGEVWL